VEAALGYPRGAVTPYHAPARKGGFAQAAAEVARTSAAAPSSRAAVPDAAPVDAVDAVGSRGRNDGNGSPPTGRRVGVLGRDAPRAASLAGDLPSPLARGDHGAGTAGTPLLSAGPPAEAGTGGVVTVMPAPPRSEVPPVVPGRDRAGPPNRVMDVPDRMEIGSDPEGQDPGARGAPDTAPAIGETARGGSWQAPGSERPVPAGPFAAPAGAGLADGDPLAPGPPEAAKGAAVPAKEQADPPRPLVADPPSPRGPVLAGAVAAVLPSALEAHARAASAMQVNERGKEPPEPSSFATPAGSRSVPEAIEGGALSTGRSERKTDSAAAPAFFPALSVNPAPGDTLPDVASAISGAPGARSPEDGASGSTPLPGQDPGRSVAMQLAAAVSVDRRGAFEIRLSPEELGVVKLTLHVADGTVALAIEAERPETLELMRRSLDVLEREFRDAGFTSLNLSFGDRGGDRQPTAPAAYAAAVEDRPASAGSLPQDDHAPVPRAPSSAQLDLRL
jgi:flagellar hook-length control protein FliK